MRVTRSQSFAPSAATEIAKASGFDVRTHTFNAAPEQLRPPRRVRVGIYQHAHPVPPGAPILEQRTALYKMAEQVISAAALSGVNVFCFQETWSKAISLGIKT